MESTNLLTKEVRSALAALRHDNGVISGRRLLYLGTLLSRADDSSETRNLHSLVKSNVISNLAQQLEHVGNKVKKWNGGRVRYGNNAAYTFNIAGTTPAELATNFVLDFPRQRMKETVSLMGAMLEPFSCLRGHHLHLNPVNMLPAEPVMPRVFLYQIYGWCSRCFPGQCARCGTTEFELAATYKSAVFCVNHGLCGHCAEEKDVTLIGPPPLHREKLRALRKKVLTVVGFSR